MVGKVTLYHSFLLLQKKSDNFSPFLPEMHDGVTGLLKYFQTEMPRKVRVQRDNVMWQLCIMLYGSYAEHI